MFSRGIRILILLFVVGWFGAIVPGHTRGVVKLPGARSCETVPAGDSSESSCCSHKPSKENPTPRTGSCAVCYFAATLMVAPPVSFEFARLGLVGALAPPAHERVDVRSSYLPCHSRAPPAVA
jgi:hypothetical protein